MVANGALQPIEAQPLRQKHVHASAARADRPSMRRAAFSTCCGVRSSPDCGGREELLIGHGVPQEVGKAAGRAVLLEPASGPCSRWNRKVRGLQHGLDHELRASEEVVRGSGVKQE